jgi:uncharacterized GH25 family protein
MKILKSLLLLLIVSTGSVSAHSLWMETAAAGKIGQAQNVKLHFGEYAQGERDELSKWYSDLKDLTLWLTTPDGKKEQLTVTQGTNFCEASFTPANDGVYTLTVSHKPKALSGTTQYEFSASSTVSVGKNTKLNDIAANTNDLKVAPENAAKVNAPLKVKVWQKGENKAGNTVMVFSPAGWGQELTTAADGTVTFTPLWPGKYVLEATAFTKIPGEANGNKYEALWQGATYSFDVSK